MYSANQFTTVYRPCQPALEQTLDTYTEYQTDASHLLNKGVKFYGFYLDQRNADRLFVFPDGCLHLVICCDKEHPSANICGSLFKGREGIFVRSECEYFDICFLPGYAEFFFKHPVGAFSELEVPIQDVLPHAEELLSRVVEQTSLEGRVRAFKSYCLAYIGEALEAPPLIQYLADKIINCSGKLNVNELSQDTGYSTRYMLKSFEKYVGLSPKLFSRIIRFQHVIRYLNNDQYQQTLDRIYELGYFDQNHFIKEFKEFSLLTPKKYVRQLAASNLSHRYDKK